MATEFSMLGIMNAALVTRGWDEIVSESDGTPEFRAMARNWPGIVEAELEDGLYNFTKAQNTLNSRVEGLYGYTDGYIVPGTSLHVRRLWLDGGSNQRIETDWVQDGSCVYLDNSSAYPVVIEHVEVSDASLWGANFCNGVQKKLEAVLIRAFEGESAEAREADGMAEEYFQRARTKSSKSRTPSAALRRGSIATARFGRGAR